MRAGPRWAPVPPASSRWFLPTQPRQAAYSSIHIYHPVTVKGLLGWEVARGAAAVGAFRLLPGNAAPPDEVMECLSSNAIGYRSLAVARANHPARYLVLLLDDSWHRTGVAKMAFDQSGRDALDKEASAITAAAKVLTGRVRPPRLESVADGLLVLEPVDWRPRLAPWRLPGEVARELGAYSKMAAETHGSSGSAAHGDFAPWNLLRTNDGWVVLDWEHSSRSKPPFFDLWHYLVQAHSLLGRPSTQALLRGLDGRRGWVRTALVSYAEGSGMQPVEARTFFDSYIRASADQLEGKSDKEQHGLSARTRLRQQIVGSTGVKTGQTER
jgi:hypothetical protein